MRKTIIAMFITTAILSGCAILEGIQAPSKFQVNYNCPSKIQVAHNVAVSVGCDGVDTIFIGSDTAILIPNK